MFESKIESFAKSLEINKKCSSDERDYLIYGLSVGIGKFLIVLTTLIIGTVLNLILESVIYIAVFSSIRRYIGGFHCGKSKNCYFFSCLIIFSSLLMVKYIPINMNLVVNISFIFTAIILVSLLAPCEAKNKPLDQLEKIRYRKNSFIIITIEIIIVVISIVIGMNNSALAISTSLFVSSILLTIKER